MKRFLRKKGIKEGDGMHRLRKERGAGYWGGEQMRTSTVILSMYLEMP